MLLQVCRRVPLRRQASYESACLRDILLPSRTRFNQISYISHNASYLQKQNTEKL